MRNKNSSIVRLQNLVPKSEMMGRSMALAFRDEPNFAYMLPEHETREQPLAWFFGSFVARLGLRYGRVYTTRNGSGGAIWMRPGASASVWGSISCGLLAMPFHFGLNGTRRYSALGSYVEKVRREFAPNPHWYLVALAIHPEVQGRGLGAALIRPVLSVADEEGIPCYLETFGKRIVEFYKRLGFNVSRKEVVPEGGPEFWCMVREPNN